jgi:hypothetical protein
MSNIYVCACVAPLQVLLLVQVIPVLARAMLHVVVIGIGIEYMR